MTEGVGPQRVGQINWLHLVTHSLADRKFSLENYHLEFAVKEKETANRFPAEFPRTLENVQMEINDFVFTL